MGRRNTIETKAGAPLGDMLSEVWAAMLRIKAATPRVIIHNVPESSLWDRVIDAVGAAPMTAQHVVLALGLDASDRSRVGSYLARGLDRGLLVRVDEGVYGKAGVKLEAYVPKPRYTGDNARIIALLSDDPTSVGNVVRGLGLHTTTKTKKRIANYMGILWKSGAIRKVGLGMYAANSNAEVPARGAKGCGGVSAGGGAVKAVRGGKR